MQLLKQIQPPVSGQPESADELLKSATLPATGSSGASVWRRQHSSAPFVAAGLLSLGALGWFQPRCETVDGNSMLPTLTPGEQGFSVKRASTARFDLVVFRDPEIANSECVKRVIGLPGETIEFKYDRLLVNGHEIAQPPGVGYLGFLKAVVVPPGELFVLGDNRENSTDSRVFGCVPENSVRTLIPKTLFNL